MMKSTILVATAKGLYEFGGAASQLLHEREVRPHLVVCQNSAEAKPNIIKAFTVQ